VTSVLPQNIHVLRLSQRERDWTLHHS